jgi:hypothetical protein
VKVLITGATGFIGRALVERLLGDGRRVTAWVRSTDRARALLGAGVDLLAAGDGDPALRQAVRGADAVINLAGEPIFGRRWSAERQVALVESRLFVTAALLNAMEDEPPRPAVLVSVSAVGYYGDRGDVLLDETVPAGQGFLARLCADWERTAGRAGRLGVRVVTPRIGLVLGPGDGLLGRLLPQFRAGLGGTLGRGRQFMSWIHLDDLVRLLCLAIVDGRYQGPINAVAPEPVTNREFTRALAGAVGRPAFLSVPAMALELALGESARALLSSQRVDNAALRRLGFEYRHPDLAGALAACLRAGGQ